MSPLIATVADLSAVMQLIQNATAAMLRKSIDQWGDFYPTEAIIREDIKNESLYCLEIDTQLIGIVVIDDNQPQEWSAIEWPHVNPKNRRPLIVHRLAVEPAFQGRGYGRKLMEWVENHAKSQDYTSMRLDAYQGNPAALALYENHQFIKTGQFMAPHRSLPFNCYEKVLALP